MNRSTPQVVQSNRPALRRLHRRPAPSHTGVCMPASMPSLRASAPDVVSALPASVVREAGMFELLAAETRIVELEKALAEARAEAFADPLTGALNRRGFERASQREIARARRNGSRFALAHIDLDNFKQLNDTLGHQAGDRVLVHFVALLQRSMRPTDVLSRFGGEEFVLMLPETSLEDAEKVVNRFLNEFSAQIIPGVDQKMTFSAGVSIQSGEDTLEDVITRADTATYEAKRQGKNRVVTRR